jgi:FlaA1/EpsC-like NDP-sugar epimerase
MAILAPVAAGRTWPRRLRADDCKLVMNWQTALAVLHDLLAVAVAWFIAFWLRFNLDIPVEYLAAAQRSIFIIVPLYAAIFWQFGLYRGVWRYASVLDLRRILLAVGIGAASAAATIHLAGVAGVPRSVLLLQPLLLVLIMGGSRFAYRAWRDGHLWQVHNFAGKPVLVLGAGDAASLLLRDLGSSNEWRAVGLLDDAVHMRGRQIQGVTVLGKIDEVALHGTRLGVAHAIIAMPSASAGVRRRAVELAGQAGLTVLTVPALEDVLSGRVAISSIRRVELEDLLGREPVQLDEAGLRELLADKVVMVTGAGGSIGSELCRQIARFAPARLVLFEQSEFALYRIEQEFNLRWPDIHIACLIGDVKDAVAMDAVLAGQHPAVLFHAAAYKHVPLMERDNAWAAVRNNVLGTLVVAAAARRHDVAEFVLISTDKAVNPTNVMGASKRLAEMVCAAVQAQDGATERRTRFVTVRFGNVLGSSGSVIPTFRKQIARGGPVTVTHPDIVRYFMLIPEAAQLVLQAGLMAGKADSSGQVFVLDMGEPVKIVDLARDMIRLSGFSDEDIRIEFTGLRPGEKLYEELLADDESTQPTPHPKLRVARAESTPEHGWLTELEAWLATPQMDEAAVKRELALRVAEYRPQSR